MKAPILDPSFVWIPASAHSDVAAFAERQRKRMADAQRQREANEKEQQSKVRRIKK